MNDKPPTPKRGAFPTPKEVIEKAPRYIPDRSSSPGDEGGEPTASSPDCRQDDDDTDDAKQSKPK
jgi:hypothetical protein